MKYQLLILLAMTYAESAYSQMLLAPKELEVTATTNKVTFPDGTRRDSYASNCVDAPPGSAFAMSSAKIVSRYYENWTEAECTFSPSNYKELVPNFLEPTRLCVNAWVVSLGGPAWGQKGKLTCKMSYSAYNNDYIFLPPSIHEGHTKIANPSIPMMVVSDREVGSYIEASIPIRAINSRIGSELERSIKSVSSDTDIQIISQGFRVNPYDSRELTYYLDIDANTKVLGLDVGFRCDLLARFIVPTSQLKSISLADAGTTADCRSGSYIAKLLDYQILLKKTLSDQVKKLVSQSFDLEKSGITTLAEEDPELAGFAAPAWLYGRHCTWKTEPAICFGLTWSNKNAFRDRNARLDVLPTPNPQPFDEPSARAAYAKFRHWVDTSGFWPSNTSPDRFPAGFKTFSMSPESLEDNDMVLFSGIMCSYGISEGCDLIRRSIDSKGRPWRSPRRIDEAGDEKSATFSGDHLKGLLLYWAASNDRDSFKRFLKYIQTEKTASPNNSSPVQNGYSTCAQREPNFTCMIASDWHHIVELAKRFQLDADLPPDIYNMLADNPSTAITREFESSFAISGYRLHLVAVDNLIGRFIEGPGMSSDTVFRRIANRQPKNPFFAFLNEGATYRVQNLIDSQCPVDENRISRWDWAWQRGDHKDAWKDGMIWDCLLAYTLLIH